MGVEQADGLNKEKKPKLNEYNSPSEDLIMNQLYQNQSSSLETTNQTTTTSQYYYSRDETHLSNSKSEDKENVKEEPDSMTIVGNRIIKAGQPALVYEKNKNMEMKDKDNNDNFSANEDLNILQINEEMNLNDKKLNFEKDKINDDSIETIPFEEKSMTNMSFRDDFKELLNKNDELKYPTSNN